MSFIEDLEKDCLPEWFLDLGDMLMAPVRAIIKFFKKVFKVLQYIPVIWNNEDWDFDYILTLLRYKLVRTRDRIHSDNVICPEEARDIYIQINQAIDHIDRYREGGYEEFDVDFSLTPLGSLTKEQQEKLYEVSMKRSDYEQEQWNLIWDTIKKYGQGWWD